MASLHTKDGYLHRRPNVTREWPLSEPTISISAFQTALVKRQRALDSLPLEVDLSDVPQEGSNPDVSKFCLSTVKKHRPFLEGIHVQDIEEEPNLKSLGESVGQVSDNRIISFRNHVHALPLGLRDVIETTDLSEVDLKSQARGEDSVPLMTCKCGVHELPGSLKGLHVADLQKKLEEVKNRKSAVQQKLNELHGQKHDWVQKLKLLLQKDEEEKDHMAASQRFPNHSLPSPSALGSIRHSHNDSDREEGELESGLTPPRPSTAMDWISYNTQEDGGPHPPSDPPPVAAPQISVRSDSFPWQESGQGLYPLWPTGGIHKSHPQQYQQARHSFRGAYEMGVMHSPQGPSGMLLGSSNSPASFAYRGGIRPSHSRALHISRSLGMGHSGGALPPSGGTARSSSGNIRFQGQSSWNSH